MAQWPEDWGLELRAVLIYGDFMKPPEEEVTFEGLGVMIHPGRKQNTLFDETAACVVEATVIVSERTAEALVGVWRRMDRLVGSMAVISARNYERAGYDWWSWFTHVDPPGIDVARILPDTTKVSRLVQLIESLPDESQSRFFSVMHWIREPLPLAGEVRESPFRLYEGLWVAFEVLVELADVIDEVVKPSDKELQHRIDELLSRGRVSPGRLRTFYDESIRPSLRNRAESALRRFVPDDAERIVRECFDLIPERDRLYGIRNAIAHGGVNKSDPRERFRVRERLTALHAIVLHVFSDAVVYAARRHGTIQ